ncbi:MAG TPA: hypothetical protein VFW93_00125 [Aquabacterium sp.]|uniref:hypothetical protein n=1 Tax=Aquabacterium sp. TaxID=1872578 RepID=UPI002E3693BE|nr:hypothetical protein [Aquabacterium sp.]HEX5354589.1 hypothetical protein [Aquabacterium sp.]
MNAVRIGTLALVVLLSACASKSVSKTQSRMTTAATTPLNDLNLVRDEIPEVLQNAVKAPYLKPADATCPVVVTEVHQLDEVLGADLDAPESDEPSLLDRGTDAAENTAVGAIQRTAEGLVPFRSWVRKLSGAERHSRKMAAAISAGAIRRAFLKGVAASQGCVIKPPAPVQLAAASAPASSAAPEKVSACSDTTATSCTRPPAP